MGKLERLERVKEEKSELSERINRLRAFLETAENLSKDEYAILFYQLKVMEEYGVILKFRVENEENKAQLPG